MKKIKKEEKDKLRETATHILNDSKHIFQGLTLMIFVRRRLPRLLHRHYVGPGDWEKGSNMICGPIYYGWKHT